MLATEGVLAMALLALGQGGLDRTAPCLRVERPLSAGTLALLSDLAPATCGATASPRAWRQSGAGGFVAAARDLAAGEIVHAPPPRRLAAFRPGQAVRLRYVIGAVTVERVVRVVQPAAINASVFVRGADGAVFSAPASTVAP